MSLSMTEDQDRQAALPDSRIKRLRAAVQSAKPGICTERALIWTAYYKRGANKGKSPYIQMAEALGEVLGRKSIAIHPDELIVGNFSSRRVGGSIYPELHGVPVMMDLFKFNDRDVNPLEISGEELVAFGAGAVSFGEATVEVTGDRAARVHQLITAGLGVSVDNQKSQLTAHGGYLCVTLQRASNSAIIAGRSA